MPSTQILHVGGCLKVWKQEHLIIGLECRSPPLRRINRGTGKRWDAHIITLLGIMKYRCPEWIAFGVCDSGQVPFTNSDKGKLPVLFPLIEKIE